MPRTFGHRLPIIQISVAPQSAAIPWKVSSRCTVYSLSLCAVSRVFTGAELHYITIPIKASLALVGEVHCATLRQAFQMPINLSSRVAKRNWPAEYDGGVTVHPHFGYRQSRGSTQWRAAFSGCVPRKASGWCQSIEAYQLLLFKLSEPTLPQNIQSLSNRYDHDASACLIAPAGFGPSFGAVLSLADL